MAPWWGAGGVVGKLRHGNPMRLRKCDSITSMPGKVKAAAAPDEMETSIEGVMSPYPSLDLSQRRSELCYPVRAIV